MENPYNNKSFFYQQAFICKIDDTFTDILKNMDWEKSDSRKQAIKYLDDQYESRSFLRPMALEWRSSVLIVKKMT